MSRFGSCSVAPSRMLGVATQSSIRDTPRCMTVFEEEIQAVGWMDDPYSSTLANESCLNHLILGHYNYCNFSGRCNFVNLRDEEVSLSGPSMLMPQPALTDPAPLQVLFCCSWGKGFGSAHHVASAEVRNWPTFFCPDEARGGSQCHQCFWRGHPCAHVQWSMMQETNQNSHS